MLVAANVAAYVVGLLLERVQPDLFIRLQMALWLDPRSITLWGLLTYAFLHAGLWHLLGNMLFLWTFGPNVEDRFGRAGYLLFYVAAAVGSGALHAALEPAPVIGASGAIAGVTGAYLVLFPHTVIRTLFLLYPGIVGVPAWWFIGIGIAYNIFLAGSRFTGNIAVWAHLGGYALGFAIAMGLLATRRLSREPYDLFTISRQAARRRQFREIRFQQDRTQAEMRRRGREPETSDDALKARAAVTERLAAQDYAAAADAYRALLEAHSIQSVAALLNRRSQYDLANYLFRSGDHQTAATAYELFLKGYPGDHELPVVRLMLGLINARYLNDPVRAKAEIAAALPDLPEGEHAALARELLEELG